ncbi:MAG: hypothetical protein ACTHK2_14905 [Dokdonella sp.]|uniref:hypothetical protein n=1 Tax=Dokdonella sp. TaxID=2291710 RepID=UPI003F80C6E9
MRTPILITLLFAGAMARADDLHYLDLVNTAPASLVGFAVATAGSGDWRTIELGGAPLQGGGDTTTVAIRGEGCLCDLRSTFGDGLVLVQRDFDVCRYRSYHTGPYLRRARADARIARD